MTLPGWVLDALVAQTGDATGGHASSTRLAECPRCSTPVLLGLDQPVAALEATASVHEIDKIGEAIAVLNGLRTFHLIYENKRWVVARRGIDALNCGVRRFPVLAEHNCGVEIPPAKIAVLNERPNSVYPEVPPW